LTGVGQPSTAPMPDFEICSCRAPADLLAALVARGGEWRRSALRPSIRECETRGVAVVVSGPAFRSWVRGGMGKEPKLVCEGQVSGTAGGSRIDASMLRSWWSRLSGIPWAVATTYGLAATWPNADGFTIGWSLLVTAGGYVIW